MPYPESCPECGGAFRNTGTHYTARRNEVGRHVLLELGCQNTSRRYWWDFTTGTAAEDGTTPGRRASASGQSNGSAHLAANGHAGLATLDPPAEPTINGKHTMQEPETTPDVEPTPRSDEPTPRSEMSPLPESTLESLVSLSVEAEVPLEPRVLEPAVAPPSVPPAMKDTFVRQLQLDRLTLRQMRSWLMADDARRAIEVAAGATEATYERLALILFGVDLPQLLGKQPTPPPTPGMSAEERLELQREKARIRARLRRAAAKAARGTAS